MAKIPEAVIEDIRNQVDITDVVSQYVQLKKSGKDLFGLCPFHEERTPSFSVSEEKQIFHCFSCGRGGNVFKFIMDVDQLSFPEAVVKVAEMNNIPLDAQYLQTNGPARSDEEQQLRKLYEQSQNLYHHILVNTQLGQKALKYLHQRGMTDEMIATFGIGYAPEKTDLLTLFFKDKQVAPALLEKSGLLTSTQNNTLIDRFVDRVMFPIRDQGGQTIAFSGRVLSKDPNKPKYLNSPETSLFNKRKILFNFDLAKAEIRKNSGVLLFEGFMDVIAAYQAGVKNGVASMGTSLTDEQLYLLQRVTNHLVICYDGDDPGQKATNRAVDMLMPNRRLDIGVVVLPDAQDPDEFIKSHSPEAFRKLLTDGEQTSVRFKLDYLRRDVNLNNDKFKVDYLNQALQLLQSAATPSEQSLYMQHLATELGIDLAAIKTQFEQLPSRRQTQQGLQPQGKYQKQAAVAMGATPVPEATKVVKYSRLEQAQRLLLYYAIHDQSICRRLLGEAGFAFKQVTYQTIFELWLTFSTNYESQDVSAFIDQLPANLQNAVADLEMSNFPELTEPTVIDDLLQVIGTQDLQVQLNQAKQGLKIAKETGNLEEELHWTMTIIELSRHLKGA
ncbi:DNA primase [Agrilactobacillus yilanensis]|uniref:DNA primase n=1 Tax=Agrilactobacillus yilanensis TaxID=2485997 RepID=A0ABW4J7D2_9LACO|nr:DNA primase [Agrilactobacillus yilanensis]